MRLEGIDHVALAVRDVARSVVWYQQVLGLERRYEEAWGDYPAVVGIGTTSIALFPAAGTATRPLDDRGAITMRHLAFRVSEASFAEVQAEMQRRGIPFEFQDHDIAHSIYFEDPDGYRLEITTYLSRV